MPIARTLGNCISVGNVIRLLAHFGTARAKRMLMLAEMVDAEEARACGFVEAIYPAAEIGAKADEMCRRLIGHAPITMRAAKEAMRRVTMESVPDGSDLIRACLWQRGLQGRHDRVPGQAQTRVDGAVIRVCACRISTAYR